MRVLSIVKRWEGFTRIAEIHVQAQADLMKIAQASRFLTLLLGFAERGRKHSRQNRDDGDDDEQFNEAETLEKLAGRCSE